MGIIAISCDDDKECGSKIAESLERMNSDFIGGFVTETEGSRVLRPKKGTTEENKNFIGMEGELTLDVEKWEIHLHDGVTPGGVVIGGSGGSVLVPTYADFLLMDEEALKDISVVTLGNFKDDDGLANVLIKYGSEWLFAAGELHIREEDVGECVLKVPSYIIYTINNSKERWTMISENMEGQEGLGAFDAEGEYDLDVRYNKNGDEYVKDKYLTYSDYPEPTEADFYTGLENEVIPVRSTPIHAPLYEGERLINPNTGEYFVALGTSTAKDWKVISGAVDDGDVGGGTEIVTTAIKQRFLDALKSETPYTYVVTGDSTRLSGEVDSLDYYEPQLAKINFQALENSSGGQTAGNWRSNTGNSTLTEAITRTPGTGSTTILEMSLGINHSGQTVDEVKQDIVNGLNTYLASRPNTLIVFVSPNETGASDNDELDAMYKTLPLEFEDSVYVSGKAATKAVHLMDEYYLDFTHPNYNGLRRLVNYIFSNVLPEESRMLMTMEDEAKLYAPSPLTFSVQAGSWYNGGAASNILRLSTTTPERRTTTIITGLEAGYTIKLDTGGDNSSYWFADDNDIIVAKGSASYHDGVNGAYRSVVVPEGATKFAFDFAVDGVAWDASGKLPIIDYLIVDTDYLNQKDINKGNFIALPYEVSTVIDANGSLPKVGESPVGQGDGTWLWA